VPGCEDENADLCTPLVLGQCGTQAVPLTDEAAALLPTKTSLVDGQRSGSLPSAVNAGFQVAFDLVAIRPGGGGGIL
jgi:hypothetical protein